MVGTGTDEWFQPSSPGYEAAVSRSKARLETLRTDAKAAPLPDMTDVKILSLAKRVLACETMLVGTMATVHSEKVGEVENQMHARTAYRWVFDAHGVVMGDMNTKWKYMYDNMAVKHSHATLSGTYLPSKNNWGNVCPYFGPAFDIVIAQRGLTVDLPKKQLGPKIQKSATPRLLMESWKWPSDHLPVVASVTKVLSGGQQLTVATWNVAETEYFRQWWPDASFGFDWQPEDARLRAVMAEVTKLLAMAHVVGLQEVPCALVLRIVQLATANQADTQWLAAPATRTQTSSSKPRSTAAAATALIRPRFRRCLTSCCLRVTPCCRRHRFLQHRRELRWGWLRPSPSTRAPPSPKPPSRLRWRQPLLHVWWSKSRRRRTWPTRGRIKAARTGGGTGAWGWGEGGRACGSASERLCVCFSLPLL